MRAVLGADRVQIHPADSAPRAHCDVRVPVAWGGRVRHVVVAALDEPAGPDAMADAEILAEVAGAGLARLDAERRHAAGVAHDRALVRAARALNASLDLREVLQTLACEAALALGAELAGVYLTEPDGSLVATAGYNVPAAWHGLRLAPGEGAAGRAVATGRPFGTDDYERDVAAPAHAGLTGFRTAIAVPMAWNGESQGALSVGWTSVQRLTEAGQRTLEAIADLATFACHNAETFARMEQAARTDALTGLLNHGAMQVRVREEIARARRDGTPLACAIVDLDDFKRVNDLRGHQAGDELLRRVAGAIAQQLRPYDLVARYGGDEFVVLLPGSDARAALQVAERIRAAVASGGDGDDALAGAGACSIGVASWQDPLDASALLERADHSLLLAKRMGKGRVALANAEVEDELTVLQRRGGSPAAVQALAAAIEERDAYTRTHSEDVVHLARGVAMLLGMESEQVGRIADAALLHDVGKLAVPHEILHKAGPLTAEEWEVMAEHPIAGERLLLRIPELAPIAPIVRHEHEHWDGTGYPDGLHGRNIPIGSRIILACDAYHAMITPRPYRPALEPAAAVQELRRGAGAAFDPEVVDALLDLLGDARPQVGERAAR